MIRRRFGRTGLAMPVLTAGGMRYQQSWTAGTPVSAESQRQLEATIDHALSVGINHIETARGYGTSEAQLGVALARHPRDSFILQTKVSPHEDPARFERGLLESFDRLRVDTIDLFGFHGLNDAAHIDFTLRPGGCMEIAERYRRQGRIKHIGFSTHAPCDLIVRAIESDRFDYVNLHYYYIFQDNRPAVEAARRHDLGVFIISPNDKGGRLYDPTPRLRALCEPLSPMTFNDLFCLANADVHTLSIGAARASDYDEHVRALDLVPNAATTIAPIVARLDARRDDVLGPALARSWREGIPEWDAVPGGINIKLILWLRHLALAYDMDAYARERYAWLNGHDRWVPGANAAHIDDAALRTALAASPFRDQIPAWLRDAHARFA